MIVGRPNVGKSTLFNRIIGEQAAIVENRPGVTRDRKELEAEWLGVPFRVIDTGGWLPQGSELDDKVSRQVEAAVAQADLVLFVVDASVGALEDDESVADWLRRESRPVLLVANKADNNRREDDTWQFLSLGLGDAVPVSALHGRRAGDLLDVVLERLGDKAVPTRRNRAGSSTTPTGSRSSQPRGGARRHLGWRSSGARTSARARCSTGSSVPIDRSCTTCPARPATRSTRWSRPRTGRSCSSTPPACASAAGSTTRPSTTRSCARCGRSTTPTSRCS